MAKMSNPPRIRQVHFSQPGNGGGQDLVRSAKMRQSAKKPRPTQSSTGLLGFILLAALVARSWAEAEFVVVPVSEGFFTTFLLRTLTGDLLVRCSKALLVEGAGLSAATSG